MTTKILTGAYPGGYNLNAKYSELVIDLAASVGTASALFGVYSKHTASIVNFGTVSAGTDWIAVSFEAGGSVVNGSTSDHTALITGGAGIQDLASTTVTNYGTIRGTGGIGVDLTAGGRVTNGSAADTTAVISGANDDGVQAYGSVATVTNFGTISSAAGAAVRFGSSADRLIVEKSAVFVGYLVGAGATLELAGGNDTITGLGGAGAMTGSTSASFSGFGTYIVDAGVQLTLTGTNALTTGQSFTVAGSLANTGTLTGPADGISGVTLNAGGTVTNGSAADPSALIEGFFEGVLGTGAGAAVTNFGTIQASSSTGLGVFLDDGGSVTNGSAGDTTARITGSEGVYIHGPAATVTNYGAIVGGFFSVAGGTVTNGSAADHTASIAGSVGVGLYGSAGLTVTNFGTISGSGGTAIKFDVAADRLVVESGAAFTGALIGAGGRWNWPGAMTPSTVSAKWGP